jgi:predicted TIM-barrel fold metal-dependent hydrolase
MNRRAFLSTIGLAAASGAGPAQIIDTHTHFYDPSRPQGVPWPPKNDALLYRRVLPGEYKKLAQPQGVTGTVVVEASAWVEDNQWVLDLAKEDPFIVGLVGHIDPGKPEFRAHLERFRKNPLFLGIRVGARMLADLSCEADFERLQGEGLALDVIGPAKMFPELVRFARRFPKLRIIMNHLPLDPPEENAALRELGQCELVHAKVSGIARRVEGQLKTDPGYYAPRLDELWDIFGSRRLVYGSNWPVCEKIAPYEAVHRIAAEYFAKKGKEAEERYFWKNSQAVYRWTKRS